MQVRGPDAAPRVLLGPVGRSLLPGSWVPQPLMPGPGALRSQASPLFSAPVGQGQCWQGTVARAAFSTTMPSVPGMGPGLQKRWPLRGQGRAGGWVLPRPPEAPQASPPPVSLLVSGGGGCLEGPVSVQGKATTKGQTPRLCSPTAPAAQ